MYSVQPLLGQQRMMRLSRSAGTALYECATIYEMSRLSEAC